MRADLHLHTTASDGKLTPEELVRGAAKLGLAVIAITDHDSVAGIPAALEEAKKFNLVLIPGVEINTDVPLGEVHILGYFIDYAHPDLVHGLEELRTSRYERGFKMVAKLKDMGVVIDWKRVLELAGGGNIGRPHIAQAMLERGYIVSLREAFNKYIGRNCPAYVERYKLSPAEAVRLVCSAHGLPVLAHPADIQPLVPMVEELKGAGLVGMEVYYYSYSPTTIARLKSLAKEHGLITSGGSDFHGLGDGIGSDMGSADIPAESVRHLLSLGGSNIKGILGGASDKEGRKGRTL